MEKTTFGRILVPDSRDAQFPVAEMLAEHAIPPIKHKEWWNEGWYGNQGKYPRCVAYAWSHWLEDGPVIQDGISDRAQKPIIDPKLLYDEAQRRDGIPGNNYEGTTVRAGAKVLKKLGLITEYRWATNINDVIKCLTILGPMVVGTLWTEGMTNINSRGLIMRPTGKSQGGHAYLINGVDLNKELFRVKNSWGKSWGQNGHGYIKIKDFETLLNRGGEACIAREVKATSMPDLKILLEDTDVE